VAKTSCWLCLDTGLAHYDKQVKIDATTTWEYDMVARCTCPRGLARGNNEPGSPGYITSMLDLYTLEQIDMLREEAKREAMRRYPSVAARYKEVANG